MCSSMCFVYIVIESDSNSLLVFMYPGLHLISVCWVVEHTKKRNGQVKASFPSFGHSDLWVYSQKTLVNLNQWGGTETLLKWHFRDCLILLRVRWHNWFYTAVTIVYCDEGAFMQALCLNTKFWQSAALTWHLKRFRLGKILEFLSNIKLIIKILYFIFICILFITTV